MNQLGSITSERVIRHAHLFCGLGAGAKGFNMAKARVGNVTARFQCTGGIDVDAGAIRNFDRLTGAKGTAMDLFDRAQFIAFHGKPEAIIGLVCCGRSTCRWAPEVGPARRAGLGSDGGVREG